MIDYNRSKRPLLKKIQQILNGNNLLLSNVYKDILIKGLRNSLHYFCEDKSVWRDIEHNQYENRHSETQQPRQPRQSMLQLLKQVLLYMEKDFGLEYSVEIGWISQKYFTLKYRIPVSNTHALTLYGSVYFDGQPIIRCAECYKVKSLHIRVSNPNFHLIPPYDHEHVESNEFFLNCCDTVDISTDEGRKCELTSVDLEKIYLIEQLENLSVSISQDKFLFEKISQDKFYLEKAVVEKSKLINSLINSDSIKPLNVKPKYHYHRSRNASKKDSYRRDKMKVNSISEGLDENYNPDTFEQFCDDILKINTFSSVLSGYLDTLPFPDGFDDDFDDFDE